MTNRSLWDDLTPEEQEKHLANDCKLTIIEPMTVNTPEYTKEEYDMIEQFPQPTTGQWYEQDLHDRVITCSANSLTAAKLRLERLAKLQKVTPVGEVFKTARYFCLRVKNG